MKRFFLFTAALALISNWDATAQESQNTPDALLQAISYGCTKIDIQCKILQAVPGVGAMVSDINMVEHIPVTVAVPGEYDPLGDMGRGVQHYSRQIAYRDKTTSQEGRIFIYGLTDPSEDTSWKGTIYTCGYCSYSDSQGAEHRIYMCATSYEQAQIILKTNHGESRLAGSEK
jgi:hypothetical protein